MFGKDILHYLIEMIMGVHRKFFNEYFNGAEKYSEADIFREDSEEVHTIFWGQKIFRESHCQERPTLCKKIITNVLMSRSRRSQAS